MANKKKRMVIALGGNALGNTLPEQMEAVRTTSMRTNIFSVVLCRIPFLMSNFKTKKITLFCNYHDRPSERRLTPALV